jgi:hypothetical protein
MKARGTGKMPGFRAKTCPGPDPGWIPVRVKKTRQIKKLEPRFDSIETETALVRQLCDRNSVFRSRPRPRDDPFLVEQRHSGTSGFCG